VKNGGSKSNEKKLISFFLLVITSASFNLTVQPVLAYDSNAETSIDNHNNSQSNEWGGGTSISFPSSQPNPGPNCYWVHIGGIQNDRDEIVCYQPPPPPKPPLPTVYNPLPWYFGGHSDTVTRTTVSTHATVVDGAAQADLNPPGLYCGQDLTISQTG